MRTLWPKPRSPYFVIAPSLHSRSAGIRVMHLLTHALNLSGERAYLVGIGESQYEVDYNLITPVCSPEIAQSYADSGIEPIAIYPDIVKGNPLGFKKVVRYLLHYAGAYGGETQFPSTDKVWCYSNGVADPIGCKNILFMLSTEKDIFYPPEPGAKRSGTVYYARKHLDTFGGAVIPEFTGTAIRYNWPNTRMDMADLLRKSERLYAYEDTAVIHEALMCGCPVTLIKTPQFDKTHAIIQLREMAQGISWNDEELTQCIPDPIRVFDEITADFWKMLDIFIEDTQTWN